MLFFFFFKQKTAYEMRISDWSSDVCSSDLMKPALEVGGDFYDYFRIDDDRVGIVIADVSGKGVPASLFMMITRTLLKAAGLAGDGPGACLGRVNELLEAENDAAMFVTVFFGIVDLESSTLVYANGGHNPPLLLRPVGSESGRASSGERGC